MKGMTLSAIADSCNGIYFGPEDNKYDTVKDVVIDSRKVNKGSLFIAIKGERSDGHDYIEAVYESGALCCITEKNLESENHSYIKVESSLQAIKDIAEYYRSVLDVKVIGITGSVGKTSTKETIAAVISRKFRVLKTLGNFNNEIGLPLTIFRLTSEDEVAVLEMGISDFGEMTRLSKIAKPDICVITNIGLCHLENLKSRDGILEAKTEIFKSMATDGSVILNGDDDKLVTIHNVNGKAPYFFGIDNKCEYFADSIENLGLDGMKATIHCGEKESFDVVIPIPGHHMVYNALAATVVGKVFGLSKEEIRDGIESLESLSGRNHIIKKNGFIIIDDCYNANPVSMKASIDVINTAIGRKVCILGDMFELGVNERTLHYEIGEYLATKEIDVLITVGSLAKEISDAVKKNNELNWNTTNKSEANGTNELESNGMNESEVNGTNEPEANGMNEPDWNLNGSNISKESKESKELGRSNRCQVRHFETRDDMLLELNNLVHTGDTILVKASHGMEFSKIVEYLAI